MLQKLLTMMCNRRNPGIYLCLKISRPRIDPAGFIEVKTDEYENERVHFNLQWPLGYVRLISFLGLVCAALLFFSTC
jgi:hypothetical protein